MFDQRLGGESHSRIAVMDALQKRLDLARAMWKFFTMNANKPIWADEKQRLRLPKPAKPHSGWVPVLVSESEMRFVAYEGKEPIESSRAEGRVVIGKDGWPVWEGELIMDPVEALNADRLEDSHA